MHNRKSGFTLVELLVVLVVITIISSIAFGAFRSVSEGNKRTTCQSNLSQIYKSVRLYGQDFDGKYPYLNPSNLTQPVINPATVVANEEYVAKNDVTTMATPAGGIGLWSLYTFRTGGDDLICPSNDVSLPLADDGAQVGLSGYVRSPKIFHCPADRFEKVVQYRPTPGAACVVTTNKVADSQISFVDDAAPNITRLNPTYLSYQANDDTTAIPGIPNDGKPRMTYSSFRQSEASASGRVRQLSAFTDSAGVTSTIERPTDQTAVLTWCRFHRALDNETQLTKSGARNFDNVLFADGSVQSLPIEQNVTEVSNKSTNGNTNKCYGGQRVRREKADFVSSAANCTP